jgi:hypothetical protein
MTTITETTEPKENVNTMSSATECINVYKAFKEVNSVLFKCKSIEIAYFKAWSILIQTQYYLTLPLTYITEANRIMKDNIINVFGELNNELIHSIIMDEI